MFSALFAKTWRLNKVMENAARTGARKMKVTITDALRSFFILFILNTIVLVVWTKIDPLGKHKLMLSSGIPFMVNCEEKYAATIAVVLLILA